MMEEISKKRLLILIGGVLGFVGIIIIVSIIIMRLNDTKYKVIIDNVDSCSAGISGYSKDTLFTNAYKIVSEQNAVEEKDTEETYHAIFRDGTCETEEYTSMDKIISYNTSAILDVEELGYSFRIIFNWVKDDVKQDIDLGTPDVLCLDVSELKYGEFNCESNPLATSLFELDPILDVLPHFGDRYSMRPRVDTDKDGNSYYTIVIEYDPLESTYVNDLLDAFVAERKADAKQYLANNGINIDNYKVEETYAIIK